MPGVTRGEHFYLKESIFFYKIKTQYINVDFQGEVKGRENSYLF